MKKIGEENTKALKIGSFCIGTYLLSYILRNLLSVVTPTLTAENLYGKEYLGILSSVYMAIYAVGQFVNGILGDIIKPKYMISGGCFFAGISTLLFPSVSNYAIHIFAFGLLGFGLSMLRGPMMKIITENNTPKNSRLICVLFSTASYIGFPAAGFAAVIFRWNVLFYVFSALSFAVGVFTFVYIARQEKKGQLRCRLNRGNPFSTIGTLIKVKRFWFYFMLCGVIEVTTSVVFWFPSYLREFVGLSETVATTAYSFVTVAAVAAPTIAVFVYDKFINDDVKLAAVFLSIALCCVLLLTVTSSIAVVNVILLCLARVLMSCISAILWSIYIPSLASHGCVSCGNGVFDAVGYAIASVISLIFAAVITKIGYVGIVLMWASVIAMGLTVSVIVSISDKRGEKAKNL